MLEILGNPYTVRYDDALLEEEQKLAFTDMARGEIDVDPALLPELLPVVLVHEMLHVLIFLGHLQFMVDPVTKRHDEASIDAVASLLVEVLRSNGMLNLPRFKEIFDEKAHNAGTARNSVDDLLAGLIGHGDAFDSQAHAEKGRRAGTAVQAYASESAQGRQIHDRERGGDW